jgi:hypothetical protein
MQLRLPWSLWFMLPPPLCIRPLPDEERRPLEAARRTAEACRGRRAQIVLARVRPLSPQPIAPRVGCAVQTVRHGIHALHTQGLAGVAPQSPRPKTAAPMRAAARCERLPHLLPHSPRRSGQATGGGDAWPGGRGVRRAGAHGARAACGKQPAGPPTACHPVAARATPAPAPRAPVGAKQQWRDRRMARAVRPPAWGVGGGGCGGGEPPRPAQPARLDRGHALARAAK